MSSSSTQLLIIIIGSLSAFISSAYAIHCWDCSSHINPGCGDPFNNHSFAKVDCDQKFMPHLQGQKATLCRKIVQKVEENSVPRVIRSCGWIEDESAGAACIKRSGTFSVLIEYCSCKEDGCNSGHSIIPFFHLNSRSPLTNMTLGILLMTIFTLMISRSPFRTG